MSSHNKDVIVVGAGLAGLSAANVMKKAGYKPCILEKSKGPSGRLSSKRSPVGSIDMGTQYFRAKSSVFQDFLNPYIAKNLLKDWQFAKEEPGKGPRYCAVPRMTSMTRELSQEFEILTQHRAETAIKTQDGRWELSCENGEVLTAEMLILATPSPQAVPLLSEVPSLQERVEAVSFFPNWTVLFALEDSLGLEFSAGALDHPALAWVSNNSVKPERDNTAEAWVLQATDAWSEAHVDSSNEAVIADLMQVFSDYFNCEIFGKTIYQHSHRWLYARVKQPLGDPFLWSKEDKIGVCGDWCLGQKIEDAFLSADQLAKQIVFDCGKA